MNNLKLEVNGQAVQLQVDSQRLLVAQGGFHGIFVPGIQNQGSISPGHSPAFHRQPGLSIFLQEATAPGVERRGGTIDRPG